MPVPILLVWRLLITGYIFAWLFAHIGFRSDEFGPRWLIYVTDLAFLLLTIGMIAMVALTIWYVVLYYRFPDNIKYYIPQLIGGPRKIYRQDNIPWFAKLCWALYLVGASLAPLVTAGYWILVYRSDCPTPPVMTGVMSTADTTDMTDMMTTEDPTNMTATGTPDTGATIICSIDIDVYTLHFHGINVIIVLADLFVSRIPYQFLHFFYPLFFMIPYVIFTVIYWGAGGTNPGNEMNYIYESLEYSKASAVGWAIALCISPIPVYWVMFLLAWLRDVISKQVSCCHRDIASQRYEVNGEMVENGTGDPETSKV